MSRSWTNAVRNHLTSAVAVGVLSLTSVGASPLHAQDESNVTPSADQAPTPTSRGEVIDILVRPQERPIDPLAEERCRLEQEAASISREIIVCARARDDSEFRTTSDSRKRYAEETAFVGDPQAPDVAGAGIFRGPATVSGMCFIPPCPPPKALIIDVKALPDAPAGSDADRVGRGLPPIGNDDGSARPIEAISARDLPGPQIDYEAASLASDMSSDQDLDAQPKQD